MGLQLVSLTDVLPNDNQFWEQEGPNWSHAIVCSMRLGLSAAGASPSKFLAISGPSGFFLSLPSSRGSEVPALLGVGAGGNYLLPGQCGKVEEWGSEQRKGGSVGKEGYQFSLIAGQW